MNLGLGLVAADQYFKEGDARNVRDYEQRKRAAELSTLDDRVAAERTGFQLRAGQNQQGLDLIPGDTAIKQTQQKTSGIQAGMGLSNAQNEQSNLPQTQEVKNNTLQGQVLQSRADLELLPEKIRQASVSGQLSGQGQSDMVLGTLGQLIAGQDKDGALNFANRIAKAAMTEGLAFRDGLPNVAHETLYRRWADGGCGLLLTGNVHVDRRFLERPGNVVIDREPDTEMHAALQRWAAASKAAGAKIWMQISHAGRQSPWYVAKQPLAPSEVQLDLMGNYKKPRALREDEILGIISRAGAAA